MATLTTLTAQSISSALQTSRKYRKSISDASELRDVLSIIEKDINLAFHYRDIHSQMKKELDEKKEGANDNQNTNSGFSNNNELGNTPANYTEFKGEKSSLHFTSLSNFRTNLDIQESSQQEVGYFLKPCQKKTGRKERVSCLWRRTSPYIDDKVDEGGRAIVLIADVKSLSFKYVGESEEESEPQWIERWMTKEGAEPKTKDKFPLAVQVEIVVNRLVSGKKRTQTMSTIAKIRFPNNEKKKEDAQENNQAS